MAPTHAWKLIDAEDATAGDHLVVKLVAGPHLAPPPRLVIHVPTLPPEQPESKLHRFRRPPNVPVHLTATTTPRSATPPTSAPDAAALAFPGTAGVRPPAELWEPRPTTGQRPAAAPRQFNVPKTRPRPTAARPREIVMHPGSFEPGAPLQLSHGHVDKSGEHEVSVTLNGQHIVGSPARFRVRPAAPEPLRCLLRSPEGEGRRSCSGVAGEPISFTVLLRDCFGNRCDGGHAILAARSAEVVCTLRAATDGAGPMSSEDAAGCEELGAIHGPSETSTERLIVMAGELHVTVSRRIAGTYAAYVRLAGVRVPGEMEIRVVPAKAASARCTAHGSRLERCVQGVPSEFVLVARDAFGNAIAGAREKWSIEACVEGAPASADDDGGANAAAPPGGAAFEYKLSLGDDGFTRVCYSAHRAGVISLRLKRAGSSIESHIRKLTVVPAIFGEGATTAVAGEDAHFLVAVSADAAPAPDSPSAAQACERVSVNVHDGRVSIKTRLRSVGTAEASRRLPSYAADAHYVDASYQVRRAGAGWTVSVLVDGGEASSSPLECAVLPAAPCAKYCSLVRKWGSEVEAGRWYEGEIELRDSLGNVCGWRRAAEVYNARVSIALRTGNDVLQEDFAMPAAAAGRWTIRPTEGTPYVAGLSSGRLRVRWRPEVVGANELLLCIGPEPLAASHALWVAPGPPCARTSQLYPLETKRLAPRSWTMMRVALRDACGNASDLCEGQSLTAECDQLEQSLLQLREVAHAVGEHELWVYAPPSVTEARVLAAVRLNGEDVQGSSVELKVEPDGVDARKCYAIGAGLGAPTPAGQPAVFTIFSCDKTGERVRRGGDDFYVEVSPHLHAHKPGWTAHAKWRLADAVQLADLGDGRYVVRWLPTISGSYVASVTLGGEHIHGSPFQVKVSVGWLGVAGGSKATEGGTTPRASVGAITAALKGPPQRRPARPKSAHTPRGENASIRMAPEAATDLAEELGPRAAEPVPPGLGDALAVLDQMNSNDDGAGKGGDPSRGRAATAAGVRAPLSFSDFARKTRSSQGRPTTTGAFSNLMQSRARRIALIDETAR